MKTIALNIFSKLNMDFLLKFLALLMVFITPIKHILISIAILIVADALTGIWASLKRGEKFSSHKFFSSIVKLFMYTFLLLMSHMMELYLIEVVPWVQLAVYFICFYEFSSFLENVGVIVDRDIYAWFKEYLTKLKSLKK